MIRWQIKNKGNTLQAVLKLWNSLPQHAAKHVDKAESTSLLKKQLEKLLEIKPTKAVRQRDVVTSVSESS